MEVYKQKILKVINESDQPVSIAELTRRTGIRNTNTCKANALELVIAGHIKGFQNEEKHWYFTRVTLE
ncbi:MAG: hypothetical protein QXX77_04565 [Candidatus Methanosuratincola sp.]